jgi:hypothetical protein
MMIRVSRVTVLAEDETHQSFAECYLKRLGYRQHQIFMERVPNGAGSGEKWVRDNYARTVKQCRRRSAKASTALIVVIDADDQEPARRQRQLEEQLEVARNEGERISHFIPKRNIETWILCLDGAQVNEVDDYSGGRGIEERISPAAETFYSWTRLNAAIPEAQRLEH